ncbi:hypothetical protein, partial [Thiolapillus sp.]|uniref:hypothetical protein n=1 Tax=Thiolapillus sp. TaxID=2017437 RepID=UPI0025CD39B8
LCGKVNLILSGFSSCERMQLSCFRAKSSAGHFSRFSCAQQILFVVFVKLGFTVFKGSFLVSV